jgi:hypothetical protein
VTQRTEMQHKLLELKALALTWVANKLFTFKQTGLDGFFKRSMLKPKGGQRQVGKSTEEAGRS